MATSQEHRQFLQSLLDARGDGAKLCPRCGCCEMFWQECENCEDGYSSHDCGEDTCCCADPIDNVVCDICRGACGWWRCDCDEKGEHEPCGK